MTLTARAAALLSASLFSGALLWEQEKAWTFVVSIRNRAGHRVPGMIGRKIEFLAEILDVEGKRVAGKELVLDSHSFLPVDGQAEIGLEGKGSSVRRRGLHLDPRGRERVEFLDLRLQPGGR